MQRVPKVLKRLSVAPSHLSLSLLSAGAMALALGVRLPAMSTDFWLDEIWSLDFAMRATSVLDVFIGKGFQHDNNHHLNTLFLYLLGEQTAWQAYRLLALVTGVAAVGFAVWIARRSWATALATSVVFASSFCLVVYSTEARGYGPAVCFALLGYVVLHRFLDTGKVAPAVLFWLVVVFGFTSHFSFAHFYLGAGLWSLFRVWGGSGTAGFRARRLLLLHSVPAGYLVAIYLAVIRRIEIGGGDPWQWNRVCDEALAWALGYPVGLVPASLSLAAIAVVLLWDFRRLRGERNDEWVLYSGVIVVAPALTLLAFTPEVLYARYFLVPLVFLLLVVGRALGRLATQSRRGAWAAAAFLVLFVVGNSTHLVPFYRYGRGLHLQAVRDIVAASSKPGENPPKLIDIGTDHRLRNETLLEFYERYLDGTRFRAWPPDVLAQGRGPRGGVPWFILHSQDYEPQLLESFELGGVRYRLWKHYPCYGPSGMHWVVYRRAGGQSTPGE